MKTLKTGEYLAPEIEVMELKLEGCIAQSYDGAIEHSEEETATWI